MCHKCLTKFLCAKPVFYSWSNFWLHNSEWGCKIKSMREYSRAAFKKLQKRKFIDLVWSWCSNAVSYAETVFLVDKASWYHLAGKKMILKTTFWFGAASRWLLTNACLLYGSGFNEPGSKRISATLFPRTNLKTVKALLGKSHLPHTDLCM